MMTGNIGGAPTLNAIEGNMVDTELDGVSGGDKKTTTPKPTPKPEQFMVVTLEQVLVSSY
jgi:hypothetical protein